MHGELELCSIIRSVWNGTRTFFLIILTIKKTLKLKGKTTAQSLILYFP